jgi:hypothetical protein
MSEERYFITEAASKIVGPLWYVKEHVPGSTVPLIVAACFDAGKAELVKRALEQLGRNSGDDQKSSKTEPGESRGK